MQMSGFKSVFDAIAQRRHVEQSAGQGPWRQFPSFAELDANKDGVISRDEFHKLVSADPCSSQGPAVATANAAFPPPAPMAWSQHPRQAQHVPGLPPGADSAMDQTLFKLMHNSSDVTELKGLLRDLTKQLATNQQVQAPLPSCVSRQEQRPSSSDALEKLFKAAAQEERAELASRVSESAARVSGLGIPGAPAGVGEFPAPYGSATAGQRFRIEDGTTHWSSEEGDALMKGYAWNYYGY